MRGRFGVPGFRSRLHVCAPCSWHAGCTGYYFSAGVWTGEEILVWGGHTQRCGSGTDAGCYTSTGARYTPGGVAGPDPRTRR